ncbi:sensor histidine kinase [Streptomyces spectabilis]|uniref:histidine kinase n=1 Tax=Streptomyces spectabilis TaxID=68270 RepID=A0A516R142_STRST|nr:histidine kinase [Streptomyces spectabilis]QDQ09378.1 sensor histidine kinase [Streptomyces spectabilis]
MPDLPALRQRLYRAPARTQDMVVAAAVTLFDVVGSTWPEAREATLGGQLAVVAAALVCAAVLVFRRRRPVAVFLAVTGGILVTDVLYATTGFLYDPTTASAVALYTVAAHCRAPVAWAALVCQLVFSSQAVNIMLSGEAAESLKHLVFYMLTDIAVWTTGRWAAFSRATAAADRRLLTAAREAVVAERVRTARELHDVVANAVTVMVLQAAGARCVGDRDPERVGEALRRIESLGTTAMAELRHLLLVLRAGEWSPQDGHSFGVADLGPLLEAVRHAGLRVRLTESGSPTPLVEDVGLNAYRLVQEALTNAVKHAGEGSAAEVRLRWGEQLCIEVVDDGRGTPVTSGAALSTGHGLLGMRERVVLSGGTFSAGPTSDGGFRVAASLPVAAPRPRTSPEGSHDR